MMDLKHLIISEVRKGTYRVFGRLLAYMIVHGGPAPRFLSELAFHMLAYGPSGVQASLGNLNEPYRSRIYQVCSHFTVVFNAIHCLSYGAL